MAEDPERNPNPRVLLAILLAVLAMALLLALAPF